MPSIIGNPVPRKGIQVCTDGLVNTGASHTLTNNGYFPSHPLVSSNETIKFLAAAGRKSNSWLLSSTIFPMEPALLGTLTITFAPDRAMARARPAAAAGP